MDDAIDPAARDDTDADGAGDREDGTDADGAGDAGRDPRSVLSGRTLSDLSVNAVPIAMVAAFVVGFGVVSPSGIDSDPLLGFHAALVAGVVLVSYVAARAVVASGGDLGDEREGSLYQ